MNDFYSSLPRSERCRVETLELFDEFEEWHLLCKHYDLLCSAVGHCSPFLDKLNFSQLSSQLDSSVNELSVSFKADIGGRYA